VFQGVPVKKCGFAVFFIKTIFGKQGKSNFPNK
jgi:hypothetical protein